MDFKPPSGGQGGKYDNRQRDKKDRKTKDKRH
jgi:hypothetical protein